MEAELFEEIDLSELSGTLDRFESALGGAGSNPAQTTENVLMEFQEQVEQFRQLAKSENRQARQTYDRLVMALRHAAEQGEDLADVLMQRLGEEID